MLNRTLPVSHAAIAFTIALLTTLFAPAPAAGASEAKNCAAEPGETTVTYGDVISGPDCALAEGTDVDVFRFSGRAQDSVRIALGRSSGSGSPCIELYNPNPPGTLVRPRFCSTAGYFDVALENTGLYTILMTEASTFWSIGYHFSLTRLKPPQPGTTIITDGVAIDDEINPAPDVDMYGLYGNTGDRLRFNVQRTSGSGSVCIDIFDPAGAPGGSPFCTTAGSLDFTPQTTGWHTVVVRESSVFWVTGYRFVVQCVLGSCTPPNCTLQVDTTYQSGTLNLNMLVGNTLTQPARWNTWLSFQNTVLPLWSLTLPRIQPAAQVPLPLSNFPALGKVGILSTIATGDGIQCAEWRIVDTGSANGRSRPLTDEDLTRWQLPKVAPQQP